MRRGLGLRVVWAGIGRGGIKECHCICIVGVCVGLEFAFGGEIYR